MTNLTVEQYQRFVGCGARQDLLWHEQMLRSDLKLESDEQRAMLLASSALKAQKERHEHEYECCAVCRIELQGAA